METAMTAAHRTVGSVIPLTLFLAFACVGAPGQQSSVPPLKLEGKMVCIGALITAGEGVKPAECYVGLLRAKAKAEHLDLQVIGQGRSGWSTGAYVQNKELIVKAMPADTTIVTILLGTNDSREAGLPEELGQRRGESWQADRSVPGKSA